MTQPDRRRAKSSDAAVVPALVSTFDFEFTLLERVTARSVQVLAASRQTTLSRSIANGNLADFLLRKQKLGVPILNSFSRFGSVSSKSHWQALPYVFSWAFHG